ncbi:hypothetical protein U722_09230 [Bacillus amyloliquefaciens LFB112]|nr:hypothetical protein U722_09230 [Bacillus amyloliquefaciens LFB112]
MQTEIITYWSQKEPAAEMCGFHGFEHDEPDADW